MYGHARSYFLQTDPVGYEDDLNFYAYVKNDPIGGFDPSGLCTGSRIENDDGTCASTGGFTTGLEGVAQGIARIARGESGGSTQIAQGLTDIIVDVSNAAAEPGFAAQRTLTGEGSPEDIATTTLLAAGPLAGLAAEASTLSVGARAGILRSAARGTGNFTIPGTISRGDAYSLGARWVGRNPIPIVDRQTGSLVGFRNAEGSRVFRIPSVKSGGQLMTNLETVNAATGQRVANAHIEVRP